MANIIMDKVLFLEDEAALAEIVKESLENKGFEVNHSSTISGAMLLYKKSRPDIIVADVMLPDGSGFDWIATIRKTDKNTPVIFLTSRSQTEDLVKGFDLDGNDYLKKPFSLAELIARMRSLLKKDFRPTTFSRTEKQSWEIGQFKFHYPAGELIVGTQKKQLTSREADLLNLLLLRKNEPLTRNEILQTLWENTDYFAGRSLDVFITKLRRYLKQDATVKIINVRGVGYKIVD